MNKSTYVGGILQSPSALKYTQFNVMIQKDKNGQAFLTISNGATRFTVPFEQVFSAMKEWDEEERGGKK